MKRIILALIFVLVALIFSACGVNIDTTLQIDPVLGGQRVITCTIDNLELEHFMYGGRDGLEFLIRQKIPECLTYDISDNDKQTNIKFTLGFKSNAEYIQKVSSVLKRSSDSSIVVCDNIFRKGAYVYEDFTSEDLLGWLIAGLIDSGIFTKKEDITYTDNGTELIINKNGSRALNTKIQGKLLFNNIQQDNGADYINISTDNNGSVAIRTIMLAFTTEKVDRIGKQRILDYLSKGGHSIKIGNENERQTYTIEITGNSMDYVADKTGELLGSDGIYSYFEYLPDFNVNYFSFETLDVSNLLSITNSICSYKTIFTDTGSVVLNPESSKGLQLSNYQEGKMQIAGNTGQQTVVSYNSSGKARLDHVEILTDISKRGKLSRIVRFFVPREQMQNYGESYNNMFLKIKPVISKGSFYSRIDQSDPRFFIYIWEYCAPSIKSFSEISSSLFKNSEDTIYQRGKLGIRTPYNFQDYLNFKMLFSNLGTPKIDYSINTPKNASLTCTESGKNYVDLQFDGSTRQYTGSISSKECRASALIVKSYLILTIIVILILILLFVLTIVIWRFLKTVIKENNIL